MLQRRGWKTGTAVALAFLWGAAVISAAGAAEPGKIGYVDAQKVLDGTKAGKKAKDGMQEFVKSRQKIIDLDENEIKQIQEDLGRQAAVLSPEARREKEDALQKKFLEYQKRAADLNKEVQTKNKEILEGFSKQLEGVVKKIAERGGYIMILDRNTEGGVVLYAKETLDVTPEVIKELEKSAP